jgi:serine/threonine protein kinase
MNILISANMEAKVADFGTVREQQCKRRETLELSLGRSGSSGSGVASSHMSTQLVVGTKVYMPPEYERFGHISIKVGQQYRHLYLPAAATKPVLATSVS